MMVFVLVARGGTEIRCGRWWRWSAMAGSMVGSGSGQVSCVS